MFFFLKNLKFRTLMMILAAVPLSAAIVLGGVVTRDALVRYTFTKEAVALVRIARSGGAMLNALAIEAAVGPAQASPHRPVTDAAFEEVLLAYDEAFPVGKPQDPILKEMKDNFASMRTRLADFRRKLDGGDTDPSLALKSLQPISAIGLDITGRAAGLINDSELSKGVQGYFAFLQVDLGYLIFTSAGRKYTAAGSIDFPDFKGYFMGRGLISTYYKTMQQFVPPAILAEYKAFSSSPDGQLIEKVVADMGENRTYAPAAGDLAAWISTMDKRKEMTRQLLSRTSGELASVANAEINAAKSELTAIGAILLALIIAAIALSVSVSRTLSSAIRSISVRMTGLVEGDRDSAIPYTARHDEIGDIAKSVEIFRQAAIRSVQLETQAVEARELAEAQRADMQRQAEAEAEARLDQTTRTFATNLRRLAQGDMMCEIDTPMTAQFEGLRSDFNTSVRQLRKTLVSFEASVSTVAGGSTEISDASDNLSKRTEQQAASLEETAAALEQITANVTSTSKRTNEARDVVRDARAKADLSGKVVGDAVSAMEKIENSSRQIGQIISVIDEIAFQTNLLALNAGVEAARAGEAGKGFAVVAQEVRELAQRSAKAAKEIKQLVGNSEVAVSEGVRLVSDTGSGLAEIAELVQSVNTHMDAIATAAQEQSVGLKEVNTAVNHMDQATQQNAAMVEEMSAAGAALAQESVKLEDLLSHFQLGRSADKLRGMAETMRRAISPSVPAPPQPQAKRPLVSHGNAAVAAADEWQSF